jgi:hypothetical protein
MRRRKRNAIIVILPAFALAACLAGCSHATSRPSASGSPFGTTAHSPTGGPPDAQPVDGTDASPGETAAAGTGTPPAAGGDATAAIEYDWRDIPVMPDIGRHVRDLYLKGKSLGRDPLHFSVIGDCQAIPLVFLGPYERGELEPDPAENYLWEAIRRFQGSFSRSGMAVRGGFNAASILSPLQADPHYCLAGETPLTCEYRLHNPSVVFIMLETWLDPGTVGRYEGYLRQILEYVLEKGSIPILMTKADSAEMGNGSPVINPAIVRAARDYDVPVINFWRSAQNLENGGIDPNREGFHLSEEGFRLKNILALRTLYKVWNDAMREDTPAAAETPAATPTARTDSPSPSAPQFKIPDCAGGCIFSGTAISRDGSVSANGVLAFRYATGQWTQVLGPGFDLQDVSADGSRLLVNDAENLYEADLTTGTFRTVSGSFFSYGKLGAYWTSDDSRIVFLDRDHPIETETGSAINLFPSVRDGEIYFESGSCAKKADCTTAGVYRSDDSRSAAQLKSYSQLVFSPDGRLVAFLDPAAATKDNYFHIPYLVTEAVDRGAASRKWFFFPGEKGFMVNPDVRDFAFSPDGGKIFILYDVYSDYYERSLRLQPYCIDIASGRLESYRAIDGAAGSQMPRLVWSPEGDAVLLFLVDLNTDNKFALSIYRSDLATLSPYAEAVLVSADYFFLTNLYWRG